MHFFRMICLILFNTHFYHHKLLTVVDCAVTAKTPEKVASINNTCYFLGFPIQDVVRAKFRVQSIQ